MKQRTFSAGETVTAEGQSGVGFFVIEERRGDGDGRRRGAAQARPGRLLRRGRAAQRERQRTATITAESDLSCYGLTSWEFRPLVETHGDIAWKLLQAMSKTYQ